jgi:hypothetical protein
MKSLPWKPSDEEHYKLRVIGLKFIGVLILTTILVLIVALYGCFHAGLEKIELQALVGIVVVAVVVIVSRLQKKHVDISMVFMILALLLFLILLWNSTESCRFEVMEQLGL